MTNDTFREVSEILKHIMENNTVPRNIRRAAEESHQTLNNKDEDETVRSSAVILKLDDISNDPNIPTHARTLIWEILSKLESL
ncbi:UPF0147 family protein [Methanobrevibacter filiformis]|uniref:UPF0147 protein MBFIL_00510 n=1 Tax=Methanobrevibacter filiformis TaxID=55758 RepID=A0A166FEW5_9EURY|nr:UPF0147 family protein [Methanobrevibacter filiformis]KZX17604.1 hypothetical protein MBFIL_00510 [Methanobrevibacter filiformis]